MKIAYISHHSRPCYEYNLLSQLPFEKIKFIDTDFKQYPTDHPENVEYCKVPYKLIPFFHKIFHSSATPVRYLDYEKYLEDVDVIIVLEAFSTLSRQFIEYSQKKNKKSILLIHELITSHPIYKLPFFHSNKNYTIKNADKLICVSEMAREHIISLGANIKKTEVIYSGVDINLFKSFNNKKSGFIFVGRLDHHKGIDIFIQLYKVISKENPDIKFGVVGDGTYRKEVEMLAATNSNFKYYGKVENKKLPELLNEHNVYILPARDTYKFGLKIGAEQFGFSLVEAMACGLTIVSTNCGAIPEIITDNNILCNQEDFQKILLEVENLLKNPEKIIEIGNRNIEMVEKKFNILKQSKELINAIEK